MHCHLSLSMLYTALYLLSPAYMFIAMSSSSSQIYIYSSANVSLHVIYHCTYIYIHVNYGIFLLHLSYPLRSICHAIKPIQLTGVMLESLSYPPSLSCLSNCTIMTLLYHSPSPHSNTHPHPHSNPHTHTHPHPHPHPTLTLTLTSL